MRYGHFLDHSESVIDEVLAVYMPEGQSYTGQEQVEIYCHGGHRVVRLIQDQIVADGARVAQPGEFTRLAFLAGRIDLTKAEAVAEIIAADTDTSFAAARDHLLGSYKAHIESVRDKLIDLAAEIEASIDYPEDEVDTAAQTKILEQADIILAGINELAATYRGGRIVKEGFKIAICGRPNAGKSSLFNLLLKQQRALVTPTPGTTRDYLSEWIDLGGFKVNIIDTAGLRQGGGAVEREGQKSARNIIASSNLVVWITDLSMRGWPKQLQADIEELGNSAILLVGNKIDKIAAIDSTKPKLAERKIIPLSCKSGSGLKTLTRRLVSIINETIPDLTSGAVVTSARHKQKLTLASKHLRFARKKISESESPELIAFELRRSIDAIDEITGRIYTEEILGRIFSKFCIGK